MKTQFARKFSVLIAIAALQTGCAANVGSTKVDDVGSYLKLEKHITTKYDVFKLFGQPARVKYFDGGKRSTWDYIYAKGNISAISFIPVVGLLAGGVNSDTKVATIHFDLVDTYANVETESATRFTNHWVGVSKGTIERALDKNAEEVQREMEKYNLPFDKKFAKRMRGADSYIEH